MSIAEKLTTVAENVQKVYDAGHKKAVEKYLPPIEETGSIVRCEPVTDYPFEVVSTLAPSDGGYTGVTLTRCGKNLFDYTKTTFSANYVLWGKNDTTSQGVTTGSSTFICSDYVDISHLQGQTICLNHTPYDGMEASHVGSNAGLAFYDADKVVITGYGTNGHMATVPTNATYIRFSIPNTYTDGVGIQIELGDTVTEFEPFTGKTFTVDFGKTVYGGSFNWATGVLTDENGNTTQLEKPDIDVRDGVNVFYSDTGDTTGRGRADLVYADGYSQAESDFWDVNQQKGYRTVYTSAYSHKGWTDHNFKPKYDIVPATCRSMFYCNSGITDLKSLLEKQGVVLDTSKSTDLGYMFYGTTITHIPTIDASSTEVSLDRTFYGSSIKTIEKIIIPSHATFGTYFIWATDLEEVTVEGVIGNNGFSVWDSTKLSHDSLMSIINCLADYSEDTSGTSWVVTLGTKNLAKLTDEEKAIATEKGWTLA